MTPKQQEAVDAYVENAAARGIDPVKARAQAEQMIGLINEFKPAPSEYTPSEYTPSGYTRMPQHVIDALIPRPRSGGK